MESVIITPELLKEIRNKLGITQAEAAKRCRVTLVTWGRWECGMIKPQGPATVVIEMLLRDANGKAASV